MSEHDVGAGSGVEDGDISELMSQLSRVMPARSDSGLRSSTSSATSAAMRGSGVSGASGPTTPARATLGIGALPGTMDEVLSPETTRRLYAVNETPKPRSGRGEENLYLPGSALRPPSLSNSRRSSASSLAGTTFASASDLHIGASRGASSAGGSDLADTRRALESAAMSSQVSARKAATGLGKTESMAAQNVGLGVADESELEAQLAADPCVLCFEDKVVLRSRDGGCVSISQAAKKQDTAPAFGESFRSRSTKRSVEAGSSPSALHGGGRTKPRSGSTGSTYSSLSQVPAARQLEGAVSANPTDPACEFLIVGTQRRTQGGVVKHGDVVALVSRACGRYLGAFSRHDESGMGAELNFDLENDTSSDDEVEDLARREASYERDWRVLAKRKVASRREHWTIVELDCDTPERTNEREQRVAASVARMGQRARQLGYSEAAHHQLAPSRREVQVTVRSSDTVLLRSAYAEGLYLSCVRGKLRLTRIPPSTSACHWSFVKVPAPFQPVWARQRRLLNGMGSMVEVPSRAVDGQPPRAETEDALVDDLLFALQGIEGELVRCSTDKSQAWTVDESRVSDQALFHIASRFLPLCGKFVAIEQFAIRRSRAEFGRVSHALSASIRSVLREYQVLIAQLEHQKSLGQLSIQKLWFYIQPSMRTLEVLDQIARRTGSASGGVLLNTIHQLASRGGDAKARAVYTFLIQNATVPYLEMLELWIYHGVIRDPYDEFMVRVDEEASKKTLRDDFNARYWDSRYTLRQADRVASSGMLGSTALGATEDAALVPDNSHVPFFLQRLGDKILTTGKYLNVVRECGRWVTNECEQHIPYSDESHAYDQIVSRAHDFASRTLLALLLEEKQLVSRLRSIKHYFLLDQGDFFVHFMDIAKEELEKPVEQITVSRLQSLLEMCLRVRNVNDPFQEDLACELVPYTLIQHVEAIHEFAGGDSGDPLRLHAGKSSHGLIGVDAFTLDFKVGWPLSLVLSRQALTKYQLIFRHLFFCKHVERQLCTTWLAHQTTKELNLRSALGPDYCLRQRMLHFLQNFEYYVMFEVLEPRWHELEQRLAHVKTVDELMRHHSEFLDTCLRECLLTHQGLLKTLAKIMTTCLLFAEQIGRFADQLKVDEATMQSALKNKDGSPRSGGANENSAKGENRPRPRARVAASEASEIERENQAARRRYNLRKSRIKVQEDHIRAIVTQESYRAMIRRSQTTFDEMLSTFMDELLREATHGEYHSHLSNLCTRLDFNAFYKT